MSTFIAPPALRRTGVPLVRSAARFHFLAARRSLDAITGQVGTLVRAATGTSLDSNGATITWPHSAARGEVRTVSGATRYGLRMGADDLTWPCDFGLEAATFYVEFVQLGAAIASGAGVAYCGRDDQTGDRVSIQGAAANALVVNLNLTAGLSTGTFASAVALNDHVFAVVQITDSGGNMTARIGGQLNGVDVAWSSAGTARARSSAWGSGAKLRANRVGSAGTQNDMWLGAMGWFPGALTAAEIQSRL